MKVIENSVGRGGKNDPGDVRLVQLLLNEWLGRERKTLLKPDGIAGPLTNAAIEGLQKAKMRVCDGRVDPEGPTILALVALHVESLAHGAKSAMAAGIMTPSQPMASQDDIMASFGRYLAALRRI